MRRIILALLSTAALAACGNVKQNPDAPPGTDADTTDADTPVDAGPDGMTTDASIDGAIPLAGQDISAAGGRVTGPTFTLDVQIGHPTAQNPAQGATYRLEANTPIKP